MSEYEKPAHETEAEPSPEALATQELTRQAERILAASPNVSRLTQEDGTVTDRVGLIRPSSYQDFYTGKTVTRLGPVTLERDTGLDGSIRYRRIDPVSAHGPISWGSEPNSEAQEVLWGLAAQRERTNQLKVTRERLDEMTASMGEGGTYNVEKQVVIRGRNRDRILKKGVAEKLGRIGMIIAKRFSGDMGEMTY
jgi:hypothetical protein